MRLMECIRLRVKDVDFTRSEIIIRDGKGSKDRVTMLPEKLKSALLLHLERVRLLNEQDLSEYMAGNVFRPRLLSQPTGSHNQRGQALHFAFSRVNCKA
jgi:integrase